MLTRAPFLGHLILFFKSGMKLGYIFYGLAVLALVALLFATAWLHPVLLQDQKKRGVEIYESVKTWGENWINRLNPHFVLKACDGGALLANVSAWAASRHQNLDSYNYSVLIDPLVSGECAWLKAPHLGPNTGIGHGLSAANHFVKLANKLHLTLFSDFGPTGHEQSAQEVGAYFGYGCLFSNSRQPNKHAKVVRVTRDNLAAEVENARRNGLLSCHRGHTVFDLGELAKGQPTDCDFQETRDLLQHVFATSFEAYERAHEQTALPPVVRHALRNGDQIIVAHLRRGDVLEAHVRHMRLVDWGHQEVAIRAVLRGLDIIRRDNTTSNKRPTRVFVVTEQAPDRDTVLDFDLRTQQLIHVNVTHALKDDCSAGTSCSVHVLQDKEVTALQSFTVMCHAEVLIATRSGFSHLAASICPWVKFVVATSFWCPYPSPGSRGATGGATPAPALVLRDDTSAESGEKELLENIIAKLRETRLVSQGREAS